MKYHKFFVAGLGQVLVPFGQVIRIVWAQNCFRYETPDATYIAHYTSAEAGRYDTAPDPTKTADALMMEDYQDLLAGEPAQHASSATLIERPSVAHASA
jgi:hypothetical protein